jgi:hypothetical protein
MLLLQSPCVVILSGAGAESKDPYTHSSDRG